MSGGGGDQTVGFKYKAGVFFKLCFGPIDKIIKMTYADRECWVGGEPGASNGYGQLDVYKPNLLGGEEREGGVEGTIDVGMGYPDQPINDYLQAQQGAGDGTALVPAHRGVVGLIARLFYWGNNPYLKAPAWLCQRIYTAHEGAEQWYKEKAEILNAPAAEPIVIENFSAGLTPYTVESGTMGSFSIIASSYGNALRVVSDEGSSTIAREFDQLENIAYIAVKFKVDNYTANDPLRFELLNTEDEVVLSFIPFRTAEVSSSRRPYINTIRIAGYSGHYFGITLSKSVWSDLVLEIDLNGNFVASIFDDSDLIDQLTLTDFDTSNLKQVQFGVDSSGPGSDATVASVEAKVFYSTGDINPAHFIREIHTNPIWGGGLPDSEMGDTYSSVADALYDEELGVSFFFSEDISYGEMVDEVLRTIDAVTYEDPATGKQEIKLIRPDYTPGDLPVFDESCSRVEGLYQTPDYELVNQVIIKYLDNDTRSWLTLTFQDTAAIDMSGGVIISKTIEYAGISSAAVATMVGQRDLARFSRPYYRGDRLVINRQAYSLKPGDAFKLSSARHGISELICRVVKVHPHNWLSQQVEVDFVEDIFGTPYNIYTVPVVSGWQEPSGTPQNFLYQTAFEVPYFVHIKRLGDTGIQYLPQDSCFYGFAGCQPVGGVHLSYQLYSYADGLTVNPDSELATTAYFTPYAVVSSEVAPDTQLIPVSVVEDIESVRIGHLVLIGNAVDGQREIAAITAVVADGDPVITLDRGIADTVPRKIPAGTVIYIIGDHHGMTDTEYLDGETVEGYGVPMNGRGAFDGPFTYHDIAMASRQELPYPPANLKVDGLSLPEGYNPPVDTVALTWRYRDRVLQSDQLISWFEDADYGPEAGTTFRVESDAFDADGSLITANWLTTNVGATNSYNLDTSSAPANSRTIVIRVWAVRDGLDSLQAAELTLLLDGEWLVTGDGEPLITVDDENLITGS